MNCFCVYILFVLNASVLALSFNTIPLWLLWIQVPLFVLSVVITWLFPLPSFPELSNLHPDIGCRTMRLNGVDCRIFYPAQKSGNGLLSYLHHGKHLAIGLAVFIDQPAWFFSSLQNGVLDARVDAPLKLSPGGWPLVVFSHGMGGSLEMYSSIAQTVASEGFIVVALNHSDGSAAVSRNPDNVTYSYYTRPPPSALANWAGEGYFYRNNQLKQRVQHVRDVVDAMLANNADVLSFFHGQVKAEQLFVAGHSFGGATAISAAKRDSRLKAVVGLDMWMEPLDNDVLTEGVQVPVASIISEHWYKEWDSHFKLLQDNHRACRHPESTFFAFKGTRHNNFCDLTLFAPLLNRIFKAGGPINASYMLTRAAQLTSAYLRQQLQDASAFDEVVKKTPELIPLHDTTYNTFA